MAKKVKDTFIAPSMDKLHKTDAALDKALASIKTRGRSLQRDVHISAVSVLYRLNELGNNDVRIVGKFMDVLPASYRTNALRDWFSAYGPIAWDKNKPVFASTKADKTIDVSAAIREPFWEFSPEADYVPVNEIGMLDAAIKKLVADQTKTGKHHGVLISGLEELKGKLQPAATASATVADPLVS